MEAAVRKHWGNILASLALAGVLGLAGKVYADAELKGNLTQFMKNVDERLERIERILDRDQR